MVQLREHARPARARLALGRELGERCRAHGQWLAVNDRIDLALLLGADGLHLGEKSVDPADARKLWGTRWLSRAAHDPDQEDLALRGADALVLSPIFAERHARPALGLRPFSATTYALGGISADNARACLDRGAAGVAVVGAVLGQDDPRPLLEALDIRRK
jgi:thiamine-phosphate diphosphorylase